ncbi:unnamed protein product [Auanema sp. JU1783]|nr:unnamed protein product [Auanema sp. JU1783]
MDDYIPDDMKTLAGYDYVIDKTWNGLPVDHAPIKVNMNWQFEKIEGKPHKRVVKVNFEAPLFDDPEPDDPPGILNDLYNYECIEFFFANQKNQYLEVEVGPHGHWLCILFDGVRKPFNNGEELELVVNNKIIGSDTWQGELEIPLAYFPGNVTKFNSYAIHGTGDERVYEALYPVTDGSYEEPDFHRTQFYGKMNMRRIVPENYIHRPFADFKYGDLWNGLY